MANVTPMIAQTTFGPQQIIVEPDVKGLEDLYVADLDNDGDMDVLSASNYDNKVAWYQNDGRGNFGVQLIISTEAAGASAVLAADLDNDGDLDVLSASGDDSKIAWYKNDGHANFGTQQVITTQANGANSVYTADLDKDGDLDILYASSIWNGDSKIGWFENDGMGNFTPHQIFTSEGFGLIAIYPADLDNDGDGDLLFASYDAGEIAWFENDGNGNFGTQLVIATEIENARFISAADLDKDGDLDVLTNLGIGSWSSSGQFIWYANEGAGSFGAQHLLGEVVYYAIPFGVFAADLDNDGDEDQLTSNYDGFGGFLVIGWFENEGNANFGSQQRLTSAPGGAPSIYAADLDNDGDSDVLWGGGDNTIAWLENDGIGGFATEHVITSISDVANYVSAADMDSDGDMDVLSVNNNVAWSENDGSGNFGAYHLIDYSASSAYAADLDNDGDLDVLSASHNIIGGKIAWYENDGSGHFGPQQVITIDTIRPYSIYATDLDNDGDMDVLSASSDYPDYEEINWFENEGNGDFWTHHVISTNISGSTSVYAADLDNDGDLEALSASWEDNKVAWYENDGSGGFGAQLVITTGADGVGSVYAADMDNDGNMDVLSASYNDNKIAWYKNDGNGNFIQIITASAGHAIEVYAADLDNDGDKDVLAASYGDKITWYENKGGGILGPKQIITTDVVYAESVYAADLDNDGDLDVLSASFDDGKIAWYENQLVVGINDLQTPPALFVLYPNPGGACAYIQMMPGVQPGQKVDLRITDAQGKRVQTRSFTSANDYLLTLPQAHAGIYYITLTMGKTSQTLRWVVLTGQ